VSADDWFARASRRRRYLVGVSGGADSVALLHRLHRGGFRRVVVCHLDHGLRGREASADACFVARLAERLDYQSERARVDLRNALGGRSMETAGREARHRFFADCGRRWRCGWLLLAHHADDQAETVLWNLLRGSRGTRGMRVEQELAMGGRRMRVIRPLLGARRGELREWLREIGEPWREDASNAEPVAVRNRLRHEVMPLLAEIAGREVVPMLARAAAADAESREIERWAVVRAAAFDPQGRLHLGRLAELPPALRRACLWELLEEAGVPDLGRAVLERAEAMLEPGGAPALSLPGGRRLRRRQRRMWVEGD